VKLKLFLDFFPPALYGVFKLCTDEQADIFP